MSYNSVKITFAGNGLRYNAPVHVSAAHQSQDIIFSWIRLARIDGDPWELAEIPLSEIAERYLVKVFSGATVLPDVKVSVPNWGYEAAMIAQDAAAGQCEVQVAQISDSFGSGLYRQQSFIV